MSGQHNHIKPMEHRYGVQLARTILHEMDELSSALDRSASNLESNRLRDEFNARVVELCCSTVEHMERTIAEYQRIAVEQSTLQISPYCVSRQGDAGWDRASRSLQSSQPGRVIVSIY